MINYSIGFLPIAVIVIIVAWFLTKSWVKVGYIFQILLAALSLIIVLSTNILDTNLKSILFFLSLGLLINGFLGIYRKK